MENNSTRDLIEEVINRLFVYTDSHNWDKLQSEVFTDKVWFDMSSLGGDKKETTAKDICDTWEKGFQNIDSVNHLAGNYIIDIKEDKADAFAYATATHFKESATEGKTRDFTGTYDIGLVKAKEGWRINKFKYNLKYATGNMELI